MYIVSKLECCLVPGWVMFAAGLCSQIKKTCLHLPRGKPTNYQVDLPPTNLDSGDRAGAKIHHTSDIRRTLVGNTIVDHSDVVGASPVGAAPTTSSFSSKHLASMDWAKTTARRDEKKLSFGIWCALYYRFERKGSAYYTSENLTPNLFTSLACATWLEA